MKSVILRIALFGFLFAGLSFFNSQDGLKAQTTTNQDIYSQPTGNFVSGAVAKSRLEVRIVTLKTQLQQFTEGTPSYQAVFAQYFFYKTILESVEAGKTIPQSIVDGLHAASRDDMGLQKNTVLTYRIEAINLLKA